jgi:hypothetical protein
MIRPANGTPDLFGWIERDQYVYYLTIAYMLAGPTDWPTFRRAVYGGLQAALGIAPPPPTGPSPDPRARPDPAPQQHAFALLDDLRNRYDPASNWTGFVIALWDRRHELAPPTAR